ncbi:MAG: hypothetical protein U9Q83_02895 [Bacteroidota bacterium]|nr:hypothetical protein [Bacteroidota bacterium]
MASKTTYYILGFVSGIVTGISFGILAFLSRKGKKDKKKDEQ